MIWPWWTKKDRAELDRLQRQADSIVMPGVQSTLPENQRRWAERERHLIEQRQRDLDESTKWFTETREMEIALALLSDDYQKTVKAHVSLACRWQSAPLSVKQSMSMAEYDSRIYRHLTWAKDLALVCLALKDK